MGNKERIYSYTGDCDRCIAVGVLGIFTACMWVFFSFVPLLNDDLVFLWQGVPWTKHTDTATAVQGWALIKDFIVNHQNSRLGNLLSGFAVMLLWKRSWRTPSGTPLLAELWADTDAEFNRFYLANVQFYYHPGHPYMQVPAELRRVTADTGEPVGEAGMRKYGGYFFVPYEGEDMKYFECKGRAVYDGYTKDGADIYCIPFISERDGHKYLWIYPHVNTIVHKFKTLRRIDL